MNYIKEAYKQACIAYNKDEVPVGAVIVKDGKILARAHNNKENSNDPTAHAEIVCIRKACKKLNNWYLKDCEMYVTLEPCSMCVGAIIQARIKKVYYGVKDFRAGAIGGLYNLMEQKGFNHYFEYEYLEDDKCGKVLNKKSAHICRQSYPQQNTFQKGVMHDFLWKTIK